MRAPAWVAFSTSVLLTGCTSLGGLLCTFDCGSRSTNSSSLVGFLYPDGEVPPRDDAIPELRVPLRVGLTFLPASGNAQALDAATRTELLERIRQHFLARKFIAEIVVIPDYYLRDSKGGDAKSGETGFDTLAGLQRLYNLDLFALVSHDQVTYTEENALSLTYLTIVGAYLVPGSRREVTTLVDLAVVDPATRSLLLRAGGTDSAERTTTMIDREVTSRTTREKSFARATDQMIEHFDAELTTFEQNVRSGKARVRVSQRDAASGSGGGGGVDPAWIVAALLLLAARLRPGTRRGVACNS